MIFVTVGAQMTFDRLTSCVDRWAASGDAPDVFAQIGITDWRPAHMDWAAMLDPSDYRQRLFEADAVITHAGMGTILTALEFGKPMIVMPRRGALRETRNDHQVGTAKALAADGLVTVAWDEHELSAWLQRLDQVAAPARIASHASIALLTAVRDFIRAPITPGAGSVAGRLGAGENQERRRAA